MTLGHDSSRCVRVVPGRDLRGTPVFAVLVKQSFRFYPDGSVDPVKEVAPWREQDEHWGDPATTSTKCEKEVAPFKPCTDIVVNCDAYAPEPEVSTSFRIGLRVGEYSRQLQVTGERSCLFHGDERPEFSPPQPCTMIPVTYERAYGGIAPTENVAGLAYPRNPVGCGFAVAGGSRGADELRLPNIEDPDDLITPERMLAAGVGGWSRQPLPGGLGWVGRGWYPRMIHAGTLPPYLDCGTRTREEVLGLAPIDHVALAWQFRLPGYTPAFENGASRGLAVPHLSGGEQVQLGRLTREPQSAFLLPERRPLIGCDLGWGMRPLDVVLHTLAIDARRGSFDLVWRGAHPYPGTAWLPEMRRLDVTVT